MSETLKVAVESGATEEHIKKIAREEIKLMLFNIVSNCFKTKQK